MKYIDKKVDTVIHTIVNDQTIRFQITNGITAFNKIILSLSIITAAALLFSTFWNASFPYQIDFYSNLGISIAFIIYTLLLFGLYIDDSNTFLFTENYLMKLKLISALIKKKHHYEEIKYTNISFITFKEKKNLLKSIKIYEQDDNFPSLSIDTEKAKSELELLEDKLHKFQIYFNVKRDVDNSKKVLNFLIQETSLEKHPILKNLYFAKNS